MKASIRGAILGLILVISCPVIAYAQRPLTVAATYQAELGANGYGFEFTPSLRPLPSGLTLTAPDGTVFQNGPGTPLLRVGSLTLNDLTTRFAGEWTINDTTRLFRFSIDADTLSTFPTTTTQILSPPSGSRLGYLFDVSAPDGDFIRLSRDDVSYWDRLPSVNLYGARLRLATEARAIDAIGTRFLAPDVIPNSGHRYSVEVLRGNLSPPVTWTVGVFVPEPSTIALTSLALLSLAALRRRK